MEEGDILLLLQLVEGIRGNYPALEKAYNETDKETFDNAKAIILDFQKKIDFLLK